MYLLTRSLVFPSGDAVVAAERKPTVGDVLPHTHEFFELNVVIEGSARHVCDAGEQHVRRGSVTLIKPGDWHLLRNCEELVLHNFYAAPELMARELAWLRVDPQASHLLRTSGEALRLDSAALEVVEAAHPASADGPLMLIGALIYLLGGITAVAEPCRDRMHPAVLRAVREMQAEPQRSWSVAELAVASYISAAHLTRIFTAETGVSPMAFLNRVRAERAAALLTETDLPVAAIGRMVGWSSPNYVSRRFRQFMGMRPSEYRAKRQGGGAPVATVHERPPLGVETFQAPVR